MSSFVLAFLIYGVLRSRFGFGWYFHGLAVDDGKFPAGDEAIQLAHDVLRLLLQANHGVGEWREYSSGPRRIAGGPLGSLWFHSPHNSIIGVCT